jgi:hypothetical protein
LNNLFNNKIMDNKKELEFKKALAEIENSNDIGKGF